MKKIYGKTFDAGTRAISFLNTEVDANALGLSAGYRKMLDKAVPKLGAAIATQHACETAARGETAALKRMRRAIYDRYGILIRAIAESQMKRAADPALFLPSRPARHGEYLVKAEGLAAAAARHRKLLVEFGMPADAPQGIRSMIKDIETMTDSRDRHLGAKAGATAGIKAGDVDVRGALDMTESLLVPALKKNSPLAAGWKSARKIHHIAVRPRPTGSLKLPGNS